MVDFAIDGLDEMVAFAIDGLGMTWQLHIKTCTKVQVFSGKKYLLTFRQKVLTFSTRKWPKKYLQMYDSRSLEVFKVLQSRCVHSYKAVVPRKAD